MDLKNLCVGQASVLETRLALRVWCVLWMGYWRALHRNLSVYSGGARGSSTFLKTVWRQEGGTRGREQVRVLAVLRGSLSVCTTLWDSWKCRASALKCHVRASRDGAHPATSRTCFLGCSALCCMPLMKGQTWRAALSSLSCPSRPLGSGAPGRRWEGGGPTLDAGETQALPGWRLQVPGHFLPVVCWPAGGREGGSEAARRADGQL